MFIFEWLSGLPWLVVFIIFSVLSIVTMTIASVVTRRFDPKDRSNDNLARAALTLLSSALIFTGAFTIVTSWEDAAQLRGSAQSEAIQGQGILRTVEELVPTDSSVALALAEYAESVIQNETGLDGTLEPSLEAEDAFVSLALTTVGVVRESGLDLLESQAVVDSISSLKQAREQRVSELSSAMILPILAVLLMMAVINLAGIGLFPTGNSPGIKRIYCVGVALAISGILTAIVVLQSVPFIHPQIAAPFESLLSNANSR